MEKMILFWFRRDLRYHDNHGLFRALSQSDKVLPLFIFDKNILDDLNDEYDRRINFIYSTLFEMKTHFEKWDSSLLVEYGEPEEVFEKLVEKYNIAAVYCNHDYEPYAVERDREIERFLNRHKIEFQSFKDQVIFEKNDILKKDGAPYTVFTPYSRKWKEKLDQSCLLVFTSSSLLKNLFETSPVPMISLNEMGFSKQDFTYPPKDFPVQIITNYHKTRDVPAINGTSRLSVHLRFGTISVRELVKFAINQNETYLNELIWREFYMMILYHFPHVVTQSFKKPYDTIPWRNNEEEFEKWQKGRTGYPMVDAGMRELNVTGYMHNRVRMIVASFLTKHLLIDWRWGESYFADRLLDYELSSNNGGWQWAAGSGCDAAPYFRIFNPHSQQQKFDPEFKYIKKWIPEFGTNKYPEPIVAHSYARNRALETYKRALKNS